MGTCAHVFCVTLLGGAPLALIYVWIHHPFFWGGYFFRQIGSQKKGLRLGAFSDTMEHSMWYRDSDLGHMIGKARVPPSDLSPANLTTFFIVLLLYLQKGSVSLPFSQGFPFWEIKREDWLSPLKFPILFSLKYHLACYDLFYISRRYALGLFPYSGYLKQLSRFYFLCISTPYTRAVSSHTKHLLILPMISNHSLGGLLLPLQDRNRINTFYNYVFHFLEGRFCHQVEISIYSNVCLIILFTYKAPRQPNKQTPEGFLPMNTTF